MNPFPCPTSIRCPGSDYPITNFSSEAEDPDTFVGIAYPGTADPPPIGSTWTGDTQQTCEAGTQTDATLCAERQADEGTGGPNGPTTPTVDGNPIQTYGNAAYTGTATCPDGSVSTYPVPAGTFIRTSQALADAQARSYGNQRALELRICMSDMLCTSDEHCPITALLTTVVEGVFVWWLRLSVTGGRSPFSWEISAGALPGGMTVGFYDARTAELIGVPVGIGYYTFTVKATEAYDERANPNPRSVSKTFEIGVMGITTSSPLVDGAVGDPYSVSLSADGGAPPYTYALTADVLPPGLTISSAGVISGTPTLAGNYAFTITVTDDDGYESSAVLGIEITNTGPDWATIVWDVVNASGGDEAALAISGGGVDVSGSLKGASDGSSSAVAELHGQLLYTGPGATCQITVTNYTDTGSSGFAPKVIQDGITIYDPQTLPPGPQVLTFAVGPGINSVIEVCGNAGGSGSNIVGFAAAAVVFPPIPRQEVTFAFTLG